jgi:hypothetical protein
MEGVFKGGAHADDLASKGENFGKKKKQKKQKKKKKKF